LSTQTKITPEDSPGHKCKWTAVCLSPSYL